MHPLDFCRIVSDTLDRRLILLLRYRAIDYKKFQVETRSYKKVRATFFQKSGHFPLSQDF